MTVHFSETPSLLSNYIGELRDIQVQKDRMRFRTNLKRIGKLMAYEISKDLAYHEKSVKTPLGIAKTTILAKQPVLGTILRAGLGFHEGFLDCFDQSESAFVSAYRKHTSEEDFDIVVEYLAAPSLEDKILILSDPMLATGASMFSVYDSLLKNGQPIKVIIAAIIASKEALTFLEAKMPKGTDFYIGAIDDELTAQSYIVPGLGDAGDLAYGPKLSL